MDEIQTSIDNVNGTKFQIFSGILKASRSSDGKMRLHGVASSTTKDLHGDTMEPSALEAMERAANNNLTIFLNHSYEVPEDVAGSVESARMKTRGVDAGGNPNYDLDMDILVNDANPRAVKAFEAIERGTKLGLSIGALIPDGGARKEKGGNFVINNVELLETSLVGIPANPRSWVEYAAKSLRGVEKDATTIPLGSPTLTLDGNKWQVSGTMDQVNTTNSVLDVFVQDDIEPEIIDKADPSCDDCSPGQPCAKHGGKSIEPEVTDAAVTIIQIDTGDGSSSSEPASTDASTSQEAASSNPGNEDGDYAASAEPTVVDAIDEFSVAKSITELAATLQKTVSELVETKQAMATLAIERDTAISERDAAVAQRDLVLVETKRVLDNLADTPLMRRAVVIEAERELTARFKGMYSEDFLKMLEKK
jgi:HK97 family phage prohead protease